MDSKGAQYAMKVFTNLPGPLQEVAQDLMMKSLQNPYYISTLSIPVSFALCYVPHFVKATLMVLNRGVQYNNETPRAERFETYSNFSGAMTRAYAAHLNALEMFPAFAAGVLVAMRQKVKPAVLTGLCARYVGLRLLYTVLYIGGVNKVIAALRTFSWLAMVNVVFGIFKEAL